jgi:AraC family transcriptional regulator, regulatory protein of adaptative response / methylated-DNA-[protein]-cysteine methyltransferase
MASKRSKHAPGKPGKPAEEIRHALGECFLGPILVACSAKGVVFIQIGESPHQLMKDLQNRFPKATLRSGEQEDENLLKRVIEFVESPHQTLEVPLDMRGTPFQQRVWKSLLKLPAGQTTTYSEVARKIGAPKAMRAVGNACSINTLSVVVPCHRVLRNDGSLRRGSHWCVERQRALLNREGATLAGDSEEPGGEKDDWLPLH